MALRSHRHGWPCTLALLAFPLVLFGAIITDAPISTYRTRSSEVRVAFFTTDENNRLVETVGRDEFAVVDDGMVIRDFRSLNRSNETTLDVVLLVDTSESVAPAFQTATKDVLQIAISESRSDDGRVSVIAFGGMQPTLLCDHKCADPLIEQKMLGIKAAGATPLFDAVFYAAHFVASRQTQGVRQVIILFSDGSDTISRSSSQDALQAVIASGAPLYVVDMNPPRSNPAASRALQQMAESTGGRSFMAGDGVAQVVQHALADMRASYVVTYQLPDREAGFHSLCILPKHNLNLRFHSRRGYYYEESSP